MEMMYYPLGRSSYEDSLKVIEADIQHANAFDIWHTFFSEFASHIQKLVQLSVLTRTCSGIQKLM
ncbi:hypothetical protein Hanom_Chr14g01306711 [Helianthus anomalus]